MRRASGLGGSVLALVILAGGGCAANKANSPSTNSPGASSARNGAGTSSVRRADFPLTGAPPAATEVAQARETAIKELERLASHPDPQIRANVIEAVRLAPKRLAPLVRAGLRDSNLGVRTTALMAVGWSGLSEYQVEAERSLDDPSPYVRASAIFALAKLGREVDQTPLSTVLLQDPSARVRAHAALILGELGNRSALGMLREAARVRVPTASEAEMASLRLQVAEAMIKLGETAQLDTIRAALYPSTPQDLEGTALAAQILGQVGDRGSESNLKNLAFQRDPNGNLMPAEVRLATAASLIQLGVPEAVNIAAEYSATTIPALRAQRAYVLSHSRWEGPFNELRAMMADEQPLVRVYSAAGTLRVAGQSQTASASDR